MKTLLVLSLLFFLGCADVKVRKGAVDVQPGAIDISNKVPLINDFNVNGNSLVKEGTVTVNNNMTTSPDTFKWVTDSPLVTWLFNQTQPLGTMTVNKDAVHVELSPTITVTIQPGAFVFNISADESVFAKKKTALPVETGEENNRDCERRQK